MKLRAWEKPPEDVFCPEWKKPMSECCPKCVKWVHLNGADPNTGDKILGYTCSDVAQLTANLAIAQKINEMGAAVESTRNDVVQRMNLGLAKTMNIAPPLPRRVLAYFGGK